MYICIRQHYRGSLFEAYDRLVKTYSILKVGYSRFNTDRVLKCARLVNNSWAKVEIPADLWVLSEFFNTQ